MVLGKINDVKGVVSVAPKGRRVEGDTRVINLGVEVVLPLGSKVAKIPFPSEFERWAFPT